MHLKRLKFVYRTRGALLLNSYRANTNNFDFFLVFFNCSIDIISIMGPVLNHREPAVMTGVGRQSSLSSAISVTMALFLPVGGLSKVQYQ